MNFFVRIFGCCFRSQISTEIPLSKSELMLLVQHYDLDYTITDRESGEELNQLPIEEYDVHQHEISIEDETRYARALSDV